METLTNPHVRWMIRRDLPEVMAIESDVFAEHAWTEDEFIRCLRERNCIGMVAERDDKISGYMIYELNKSQLHVLNFAVARSEQRTGVGRRMLEKLMLKLSHQRRNRILLEVRDSNHTAHLFFRAMGFRALNVLRNFYADTDDDAYVFQYRFDPIDVGRIEPFGR